MIATQFRETEHSLWRLDRPSQPMLPSPRMSSHYTPSLPRQTPAWAPRYSNEDPSTSTATSASSTPYLQSLRRLSEDKERSSVQTSYSSFSGSSSQHKDMMSSPSVRAMMPGSSGRPGEGFEGSDAERFQGAKDDEDDGLDDDDMFEGESEHSHRLRTASERVAARRKMKRFRLTHQQTRFLMSEFVKQPHPDAAHRERLSRQIPGLSPRQVQVWFQNRRAKIKRLNAEDRDRVIRMRAVPEEFDTVQALHSPYGAVHGYGHSVSVSPDLGSGAYSRGGMMGRPLMVDVRRSNMGGKTSSPGLTPPYEPVGFNPSAAAGSDIASGLSSSSSERFPYGSYVTSSANASRISTPFQGIRPLHSPNFGDASRPRADSVQAPESRSSMYPGYDADYYSTAHPSTSPPGIGFSNFAPRDDSRTRFTPTTTFSSGLDSSQYRTGAPLTPQTSNFSGQSRTSSPQYTSQPMYPTSYPPPMADASGVDPRSSSRDGSPHHSLPTAQSLAAASFQASAQPPPSMAQESPAQPISGYYQPPVMAYSQ